MFSNIFNLNTLIKQALCSQADNFSTLEFARTAIAAILIKRKDLSIWRLPLNLHKCCIQCMSYSRSAIIANMAKLHSCVARQALTVSQSLRAAILYRKERDTIPISEITTHLPTVNYRSLFSKTQDPVSVLFESYYFLFPRSDIFFQVSRLLLASLPYLRSERWRNALRRMPHPPSEFP